MCRVQYVCTIKAFVLSTPLTKTEATTGTVEDKKFGFISNNSAKLNSHSYHKVIF